MAAFGVVEARIRCHGGADCFACASARQAVQAFAAKAAVERFNVGAAFGIVRRIDHALDAQLFAHAHEETEKLAAAVHLHCADAGAEHALEVGVRRAQCFARGAAGEVNNDMRHRQTRAHIHGVNDCQMTAVVAHKDRVHLHAPAGQQRLRVGALVRLSAHIGRGFGAFVVAARRLALFAEGYPGDAPFCAQTDKQALDGARRKMIAMVAQVSRKRRRAATIFVAQGRGDVAKFGIVNDRGAHGLRPATARRQTAFAFVPAPLLPNAQGSQRHADICGGGERLHSGFQCQLVKRQRGLPVSPVLFVALAFAGPGRRGREVVLLYSGVSHGVSPYVFDTPLFTTSRVQHVFEPVHLSRFFILRQQNKEVGEGWGGGFFCFTNSPHPDPPPASGWRE